jgi:hypothetical protein
MRRCITAALFVGWTVTATLGGCASGDIDADLNLYLEQGNLDFYEDVLFPSSRRDVYDGIFEEAPGYLPLHLPYKATRIDAVITQRGDLQITSHLTTGKVFRDHLVADDLDYLGSDDWNGDEEEERFGDQLLAELSDLDEAYDRLDEDLRLILLVNLPAAAAEEDGWSASEWDYPVELTANYQQIVLDDQDQELPIAEDDIELMSRLIVGGELFETLLGQRFDEETGQLEDDEAPNLVLDSLTMPGEDGRLGLASGSFDLTLQTDSFSASSGISTIQGDFEVEIHTDRWALDDLDVQEDLGESSVE